MEAPLPGPGGVTGCRGLVSWGSHEAAWDLGPIHVRADVGATRLRGATSARLGDHPQHGQAWAQGLLTWGFCPVLGWARPPRGTFLLDARRCPEDEEEDQG